MTRKPKKPARREAETFPRKAISCRSGPSDDAKGRAFAKLVNSPELAAHRVVSMMQPRNLSDQIDAPGMLAVLRDQASAVQRGDMAHAEAMLMGQASALQALFVRLTERAMEQTHMLNLEGFMRLALRAQSQCRSTIEAIGVLRNPPIVYAQQANVTTGPQQINNGTPAPARAGELETAQSQLSGRSHGLLSDTRTSGEAGRADPPLEALGEIHRTEVPRG